MADIEQLFAEMTDAIAEQNRGIEALEAKIDDQNERLTQFVPRRTYRWATASIVLAGLLVLTFSIWAREERQRDNRLEKVRSTARAYANCEAVNRAFHGVDVGYTFLAVLSRNNVPPDAEDREERLERINTAHQALRSGLARTDCTGHLVNLSAEDAERVKGEASRALPTLPLPPPPTR